MGCQTPDRHHVMEKGPGPTGEIDCSCGSRLATFAQFAEHVDHHKSPLLTTGGYMTIPVVTNATIAGVSTAGLMGKMHQPLTEKVKLAPSRHPNSARFHEI